jgi:sulfhydrogenase subunit beta (sulfur reductase)
VGDTGRSRGHSSPAAPRSRDLQGDRPPEVGSPAHPARFLPRADLGVLFQVLRDEGRRVIGPTVVDGAVVYDELDGVEALPAGWTAEMTAGSVRLVPSGKGRVFDVPLGADGWKRFTFPPAVPLVEADVDGRRVRFRPANPDRPRLAFVGVRACEIAALAVQDRVFAAGPAGDPDYLARRADALVIAVECAQAASTCFCTSMGTGPEVRQGYDLALAELDEGFVVRVGSRAGDRVAARLPLRPATAAEVRQVAAQVARVRRQVESSAEAALPVEELPHRLVAALDAPRWDVVAERCLACANCTLVCPTCFCSATVPRSDLDGRRARLERVWDSCFTLGFAQVAGGNFRPRVRDRYRQWLTHKFATWVEQFGTLGCIGCGRCIAWCPAGIDVREELRAIVGGRSVGTVGGVSTNETARERAEGKAQPPAPGRRMQPPPLPVAATGGRRPLPLVTPIAIAPLPERRIPLAVATPLALAGTPQHPGGPYLPAQILAVRRETADVVTLRLGVDDPGLLAGRPGQFVMVAYPAFAVVPISISRFHPDGIELTIRGAGPATTHLTELVAGDEVGLRGPLGTSWPLEAAYGRDVLVVAGGIGLAPLRPLLDALLAERSRIDHLMLAYGARTPRDRLYVDELEAWGADGRVDVVQTVDRAGPEWLGPVGVVTSLFDRLDWVAERTVAYLCGPERMMEVATQTLLDRGLPAERIYLTLERHMECGVGLCGHCQLGPYFVCRDGPVFSLAQLSGVFGREGL